MRTYLDWNATAPLRPEAREAMIAGAELVGNPSSVHAEGRAAKAALERAREQIAEALGAEGSEIILTSGATEGAALALAGRGIAAAPIEHDAVRAWCDDSLPVGPDGRVTVAEPGRSALQLANSETGVIQTLPEGLFLTDLTQAFGKMPLAFNWLGARCAVVSAHKLGGPRGIGALVVRSGTDIEPMIRGGGQERGRRAGTENLIGAMGFAAAARAALRDLDEGVWQRVSAMRERLETRLASADADVMIVARDSPRLPNTTCLLTSGWSGETQVMQMDLAGYAVSAGSACSSGKVRASSVLQAMGHDDDAAASAIRISLGWSTTDAELEGFAEAWLGAHERWRLKRKAGIRPAER